MTIAIADDHLIYYPIDGEPVKILFVFDASGDVVGFTYEDGAPVPDYLHNILMEELGRSGILKPLREAIVRINKRIEVEKPSPTPKRKI